MSWFKKKPGTGPEPVQNKVGTVDPTASVIEVFLRNPGDLDSNLPDLEKTGLPHASISRIYNLTVMACAQDAMEAILAKDHVPDHYIAVGEFGSERPVPFADCPIYQAARTFVADHGQAAASIAAQSAQLGMIAECAQRLGGRTKENLARIVLLPSLLHMSGQVEVRATLLPVVGGASLSIKRRTDSELKYFKGHGLDVGGGADSIDQYAALLGFDSCRNWDMADGDAQYLAGVPDGTYDFLHSSHCLEHMVDPGQALMNWLRVVRPGGYLVVVIPDEEMYEHLHWPSICNEDHKWSFTIYRGVPRLPKSINVFDLLMAVWSQVEIIKVERLDAGYRDDLGDTDQTAFGNAECSIEFVLRKLPTSGPAGQ